MKKNKYKLVKTAVTCLIIASTFTACGAQRVDCNIEGQHVHLYVNENRNLSRYIESEKQQIDSFYRTEEYLPLTEETSQITKNDLYQIEDNLDYLNEKISSYKPRRQAYVYDYIYGTYYDYGYGYDPMTGEYDYVYGPKTGYHYDYEWRDIPLDKYTKDQVRDITYKFRFYKIKEDGTLDSKLFNSLDEVTKEYKYFYPSNLVKEKIGSSYKLPKENQKVKEKK